MPVIEEIIQKSNSKNQPYMSIKASGKSYTVFNDTDAYKQLKSDEFKVNDAVTIAHTESPGTYNGKSIVYKNITKLTKMSEAEAKAEPAPAPKASYDSNKDKVWAEKDRRMARMNALRRSIEFFALNKAEIKGEVTQESITGLAQTWTEWIYKEDK